VYPFLSWHIHSGSTGYSGLSEEALESSFGLMHNIAQKVFLEATTVCAEEMKIDVAIRDFRRIIEELSVSTGKHLVDRQIEFIKSQSRSMQ
jgi:hypothetical protein